MKTRLKRSLLVGMAAIGLLGASLGTATAEPGADAAQVIKKKKKFATTITLTEVDFKSGQAKGQISSVKALCLGGRTVSVRATGDYGDRPVGTGTSKKDGSYGVKADQDLPPSGESYTATAARKKYRTVRKRPNGDKVIRIKICLPATSSAVLGTTK